MTGSREPAGLVRVAAPADFFDFFQMAWVSAFLRAHPGCGSTSCSAMPAPT